MYYDYCELRKNSISSILNIKSVWQIEADSKYNIKRKDTNSKYIIAIRTLMGTGIIELKNIGPLTLKAGTLLIVNLCDIKSYYCNDNNWNFWWFEFDSNNTDNLLFNKILKIDILDNEVQNCYICLKSLKELDNISITIASATFTALLYQWLKNLNTTNTQGLNIHTTKIAETVKYIKLNLNKPIFTSDLAKQVGLCERRYSDLFRNIYGLTPSKYIAREKMLTASALLKNTSLSISEISYKLGYSSPFHFTKEFKKYNGVAPSFFRG